MAFAPFIAFAIVAQFAGMTVGLASGAFVSGAMISYASMRHHKAVKVLEGGTLLLFAGLTAYAVIAGPRLSIVAVRLCVDGGLLAIVLASMAIRQPFTLQYARETEPKEIWTQPTFIRSNYIITVVWAAAFAVMTLADLVMIYLPHVPKWASIAAIVLAFVAAFRFTGWYPKKLRAAMPPPPVAAEPGTETSANRPLYFN
jgi:Ca2+/Na+ antiporter